MKLTLDLDATKLIDGYRRDDAMRFALSDVLADLSRQVRRRGIDGSLRNGAGRECGTWKVNYGR